MEGKMHLEGLDVTFGELDIDSLSATKKDGKWTLSAMSNGVFIRLVAPTLEEALEYLTVRALTASEARRLRVVTRAMGRGPEEA